MAVTTDLPGIGGNLSDYSLNLAVPTLNPGNLDGGTGGITLGAAQVSPPEKLVELATNPSFEATSGAVEVRRNYYPNPRAAAVGGTGYAQWQGTGGAASAAFVAGTDGPHGTGYYRQTWNTSPSAVSGGVLVGNTVTPVLPAGVPVIASAYVRSSIPQKIRPEGQIYTDSTPTTGFPTPSVVVDLPAGQWVRIWGLANLSGANNRAQFRAYPDVSTGTIWPVGATLDITEVLFEAAAGMTTPRDYFDGTYSPDSDLTPAWVGAANASASTLSGVLATNVASGSSVVGRPIRSSYWASSGAYSVRGVISAAGSSDTYLITAGSTSSLTGLGVTFIPGQTYTFLGKMRLATPQTGTINARARCIALYGDVGAGNVLLAISDQPPNTAGVHDVRLTYTIPANATAFHVRLYLGTTVGNGDVWWDDFSITQVPPIQQKAHRPQKLRNRRFVFSENGEPIVQGRVSDINWDKASATLTAETMFQRLNIDVSLPPTLDLSDNDSMTEALGKAGMIASGLDTDPSPDPFPGWKGNLWDYVKMFCIAKDKEPYLEPDEPDTVYFRDLRTHTLDDRFLTTLSHTLNDQYLAQNIEIVQYNCEVPALGQFIEFTPKGAADEPQILTVNAGETIEYEIRLNGWVASVNQPVVMDLVGPEERTDAGAYCVAGSDGLPVTAAAWQGQGGKLAVEITDDPSVLKVIVQAPRAPTLSGLDGTDHGSPYSIAATTGSTTYNSLHITGIGVRYTPITRKFPTGAEQDVSMEDVGAIVNNPFVQHADQAYTLGVRAAQVYAGPTYQVTTAVSKMDDRNSLLGSRYKGDNAIFRLENLMENPRDVTLSGSLDTLFDDFNEVWDGDTFAAFNTLWAGETFGGFAPLPLEH